MIENIQHKQQLGARETHTSLQAKEEVKGLLLLNLYLTPSKSSDCY